ncbi:MAG: hypothetical protein M0Z55_03975 [Peptococcaceae bacterium]|nr:hypothetical protein [Peptococcaceae bacterium]
MSQDAGTLRLVNRLKEVSRLVVLGCCALVLLVSLAADATIEAIAWRVVVTGVLMFSVSRFIIMLVEVVWQDVAQTKLAAQELNSQIDEQLGQALNDDPERMAELARKMDIGL